MRRKCQRNLTQHHLSGPRLRIKADLLHEPAEDRPLLRGRTFADDLAHLQRVLDQRFDNLPRFFLRHKESVQIRDPCLRMLNLGCVYGDLGSQSRREIGKPRGMPDSCTNAEAIQWFVVAPNGKLL
jgi:hypothetical protein